MTVALALFSMDSNLHCARAGPVRDKAHCTQVHISPALVWKLCEPGEV